MTPFYVVEPEGGKIFGTKWAYAEPIGERKFADSQKCPVCGEPVSMMKWLPPYRIRLSNKNPKKWGDFVWGAFTPVLVSHRVNEIYQKESLKGIVEFSEPFEIVQTGKMRNYEYIAEPPIYHRIEINWGGANQDDLASGLIHEFPEKIMCAYCRSGVSWRKQGKVIIEVGSWKGDDFFIPRNAPVSFMITEKFKHIIEDYQLTNIWAIPAEKYGYDERSHGLWYLSD